MLDLDDIAEVVADAVRAATSPLIARIDAQAKLIDDLQSREFPKAIVGEKGERGEAGEKGERGDDGIGLADALIDKDGNLVLTMTDGSTKALGVVIGKDGADGKDGAPGETFTLDDFDIEPTDDRTLEFKFLRGDTMHTFELEFPVPIFRGAFKEGTEYRKGDMVVWGGSLWSAMKETNAKPDGADSGWMIAARKGRDGKDLRA